MRLQVIPDRVELAELVPIEVAITVTNTGSVIGGYHLRILGADPSWVTLDAENLSLFPDTTEVVRATILIPPGLGAGDRRIAVQVREVTPPHAIAVAEIELVVPAADALRVALTPMTVVCGKTGRFGLQVENIGNTRVSAVPVGLDPEARIRFSVTPAVLDLAPGDHVLADVRATARRRWFGSPVVRPFGIAMTPSATAEPPEPQATGSLVQKPRVPRAVLSLLSLLFAVTVFAVVITIALSQLVGVSAADRDLAIQVAAARDADGSGSGAGAVLGGTVVQLTTGQPVAEVTVEIFATGSLTTPLSSTATDDTGAFSFGGLAAGGYKLRFRGAGFSEIWYPSALTGEAAAEVVVQPGKDVTNLQVRLGGLPATVSGRVVGDDVAGAILSVQVPIELLAGASGGSATGADPTAPVTAQPAGSAAPEPAPTDPDSAVLMTVPIGSDGTFTLTDLASPFEYELVVSKPGYTTDTQRIDLSGGENRTAVQLRLRTGDGLITGVVNGPAGPIGNALVTATTGTTTVTTVSQTGDTDAGTFTLRGLATPATYTITVNAENFGTQSSTVSLASGQQLRDIQINLTTSTGAISGTVSTIDSAGATTPAGGVTVSVAVGDSTVQTVSQSADPVGAWEVAGLPLPGTYTVTFSRADLQSQTVVVTLDAAGRPSTGDSGLTIAMRSAFAAIHGVVSQVDKQQSGQLGASEPVGEATVTLSSGSDTYTVTSASLPAAEVGQYRIDGVKPGTYTLSVSRTGTSPTVLTVSLVAGQDLAADISLIQPASIAGTVTSRDATSVAGLTVDLFESGKYPAEVAASTTTDASGTYLFTDVDAPAAYVVQVSSAASGALGSGTLVLQPSQAGRLDLSIGAVAGGGG